MSKRRQNILNQMFDVRPMKEDGSLHWEKISNVKKCLNLKPQKHKANIEKVERQFAPITVNYYQPNRKSDQRLAVGNQRQMVGDSRLIENNKQNDREKLLAELEAMLAVEERKKDDFWEVVGRYDLQREERRAKSEKLSDQGMADKIQVSPSRQHKPIILKKKSPVFGFVILAIFLLAAVAGFSYVQNGINAKDIAMKHAAGAQELMNGAKDDLKNLDFKAAQMKFSEAGENFEKSKEVIGKFNYFMLSAASGLPVLSSKISGINLVDAGQYFAKSGEILSKDMAKLFSVSAGDVFQPGGKSELINILQKLYSDSEEALTYAGLAEKKANKVDIDSLPQAAAGKDITGKISEAKEGIIELRRFVKMALTLLGAWREQDYLLLFQNSSEIRATGGFIGSYGIVRLDNGKVKKIFIDDVYNTDGQLREKIVPPVPIQKISTAWSMHDSNWFFDFPTSAKKAAWFYEKTGGPTVSGVIALNSKVIEKLLDITGPIDMSEYETIIAAENFMDTVQFKVEKDFDKNENKPKKILADFMPKLIERLFSKKGNLPQILQTLTDSLKEKDMMIYSFDGDVQNVVSDNGFSGEIIESENDYLAVVSSNINGYKTDRVIDENINLKSEAQSDGSVINTLIIKKRHTGGSSKYDYYNKVNADYLRVYVPKGAMLIDATGQTIENNKPPIDYEAEGFKKDDDIAETESSMVVDQKTGTQIFEESGKTVFANWVFVSPREETTIIYKYRLPKKNNLSEGYQMIFQKQSGSNIKLDWQVDFLPGEQIISGDNNLFVSGSSASLKTDFKEDKIINLKLK